MASTTSLQTRTVTLLEMLGNGKRFSVPPYQRDYSWKAEQWEDLWNDLTEAAHSRHEGHYMGAVVMEEQSDRDLVIIDGQQRIATLSVLALAIIAGLEKLASSGVEPEDNRARATELRQRFISERNPASLLWQSKLSLNATDNAFYQDYLVQLRAPPRPAALRGSNALLWKCFSFFDERVQERVLAGMNGQQMAELLSEVAARELLFIQVTVKDDVSAYTVFETLNARGLELSSTDLLKNYLFSRLAVPSDREAMQRRWTAMLGLVPAEQLPSFLRYHLMSGEQRVRRGSLFKMIRGTVRSGADVFPLMDVLEQRAQAFAALGDQHNEFWSDAPECRPYIATLTLFGTRQATPLLFTVLERFSPGDWPAVLRIVRNCLFRFTVVGQRNTNLLEPTFQGAANAVLAGRATTPGDVFRLIRGIYLSDQEFASDFAKLRVETGGQRKQLARYILTCLETDLAGAVTAMDSATIEHILPENPADEWRVHIAEQYWEDRSYSVGNLTLLEASINRGIANAGYAAKRLAYLTSRYMMTRALAQEFDGNWTLETMERRQSAMARRAVHVWREDFD